MTRTRKPQKGARHERLVRLMQLLRELGSRRGGLRRDELIERLGISRAPLHRDLNLLAEAGFPITSTSRYGTVRWRLLPETELPPLGLSSLQIAALHLARAELEPLAGSNLVGELDSLLRRLRPAAPQLELRFDPPRPGRPEILRAIEQALRHRLRLCLDYRAASRRGEPETVRVEPLLLNVVDRTPYLRAWCVERQAERTYKIERIARIEVTEEQAEHLPPSDLGRAFEHSVKVWSGPEVTVRARLSPRVAWLADEYPLIGSQRVELQADGSAIVTARVAGILETMRWVLSWGGDAEALEPPDLRDAIRRELETALARYSGPGVSKASPCRRPGQRYMVISGMSHSAPAGGGRV